MQEATVPAIPPERNLFRKISKFLFNKISHREVAKTEKTKHNISWQKEINSGMGNVTNVLSGTFDFISFSFVPSQGFFGGGFIYLNVSIFRAVIVLTAPATAELPPR